MTQKCLELLEAIDAEIHMLSLRKLSELTPTQALTQLSYTALLINNYMTEALREEYKRKEEMNHDEPAGRAVDQGR